MRTAFDIVVPTRIVFGAGSFTKLAQLPLPGSKALIVTTCGQSVRRFGTLQRLERMLEERGVRRVVFDKCLPNPVLEHVDEAAALCRKESIDFVIGLGGGSAIDSAKAIALAATNPGSFWDYVRGGTGGAKKPEAMPLPVVAVTTTAGTGTEADPWMVVTRPETEEKIGYGTRDTYPVLSIVDPELMQTVPPQLTAYQGFDALFHSTEGYLAKCSNALSDLYALKAVSLIAAGLPMCVKDGRHIGARTDVALGNTLSGFVESTSSCTSEHAIEHALSAVRQELTHGLGLVLISKAYYTKLIEKGAAPERFVELARAMGKTNASKPSDFVEALEELRRACGIDGGRLADYGFTAAQVPDIVRIARETMGGLFEVDPVELTDEDVAEIVEQSL